MTEEVSDLFKMGVEVALTAVVLVAIMALFSVTQDLGSALSEQNAVTNKMQEYREFNQYEDKQVYPQDVVSAVYRYRGSVYVYVKTHANEYIWSNEYISKYPMATRVYEYTAHSINKLVDMDLVYQASVIRSVNGEVVGLSFIAR